MLLSAVFIYKGNIPIGFYSIYIYICVYLEGSLRGKKHIYICDSIAVTHMYIWYVYVCVYAYGNLHERCR